MAKKIKSLGGRSLAKKPSNKGDMNKLLIEAQKAQAQMEEELNKLDEELSQMELEASAGGGVLKVIATGNMKIKDIILSEEIQEEDFDTIKDLIIAATNEVIQKVQDMKESKTNEISQKYLGQIPDFGY
ncbi:YbaB/EbfC family nucleoid-associated protein [Petrotoga sp. 9PWA.NaAc.5.4]|uniref:YbaB/EbfC family nucleoid-associated protein n=1 Tax=Petrotoga sp. 9PWA.NaAc.5.4 TaxID=1434328 RepID=UPI000CC2FB71|nr:YbaB/EbfC family nucleoid-associated protein [Petrotoga sp. 9PWA.NaAc.5.4]PNR93970.1 DNA-binding protein [Petrotoga sp. 9PWA.NaAc.5.4]